MGAGAAAGQRLETLRRLRLHVPGAGIRDDGACQRVLAVGFDRGGYGQHLGLTDAGCRGDGAEHRLASREGASRATAANHAVDDLIAASGAGGRRCP